MITSFADEATEDVYNGTDSREARTIPRELWPVARRKMDMLDAAHDTIDLRSPPGNRLEKLKGKLVGRWSIRINDQYRLVFAFAYGNATDVQITDYH